MDGRFEADGGGDGGRLRPLTLAPPARYDDDLITIPRYAGKTNEQFTQLLLNVTVLASARAGQMLQQRLVASTKEAYRAGDTQQVTMLHADTRRAPELLRDGCCDVIVTDAPYGIAHRSRTGGSAGGRRDLRELLAAAVPGWVGLLRRGGALGLSFNTHLLGRAEVAALVADAGLDVVSTAAYGGFAHRVDHGISRDLLVARKPEP